MSSRLSVSIMMLKSRMCQVTGPKTLRHRAVSLVCFIQDTIDQHLSAQLFSSCHCSKVESCNKVSFPEFRNVKLQSMLQQKLYHGYHVPSQVLQQVTTSDLLDLSTVTSDDFSLVFLYQICTASHVVYPRSHSPTLCMSIKLGVSFKKSADFRCHITSGTRKDDAMCLAKALTRKVSLKVLRLLIRLLMSPAHPFARPRTSYEDP